MKGGVRLKPYLVVTHYDRDFPKTWHTYAYHALVNYSLVFWVVSCASKTHVFRKQTVKKLVLDRRERPDRHIINYELQTTLTI